MKKTVFGLLVVIIICCAVYAIIPVGESSYATSGALAHKINSFTVEEGIKNAKDGCKIKGYFTNLATDIIKVTYAQVKVDNEGEGDLVTVNEETGEIFINGKAVTNDKMVTEGYVETIVIPNPNPTSQKAKYVEVVAKEWSAFVFAVYYEGEEGEEVTYDSEIVCCTSIDTGYPEVYRTGNWIVTADAVLYEVMIRSDRRNQTRSYDSGLNFFVVYKGNQEIDRVENIGNTFYTYTLSVSLNEVAYYEIYAADNAGNQLMRLRVAENNNTSYDAGFESAVKNALNYLKDNDKYNPKIRADLEKYYYDYYMVIQSSSATVSNKESAKAATLVYLTEYARLKQLETDGKKEWTLNVINKEYLTEEISVKNANVALGDLKYGEKAKINLSLAIFDPKKVSKTKEMALLGIEKCREIISINISTEADSVEYSSDFTFPLQIVVPIYEYGTNIKASVTFFDDKGNEVIEEVDIINYKDYIVLNLKQSMGTINLFVIKNDNNNLLWLLTLLIIPIGGGVAAIIIYIKKQKKSKLEENNDRYPRKKRRKRD